MSDLRVDTNALLAKYGLDKQKVWNVAAIQHKGSQLIPLDAGAGGAPGAVVDKVAAIFAARTMAEHREAVDCVAHEVLWDAPDIRLTSRDHLRLATYIFKKLARPRIVPIVAAVSAPSPGCVLIELDTLYVLQPNRPWFAPITWLLPDKSVSQVHMKIGVNGGLEGGKVELMVARWTNWPPIPPFGWQRGLAGMLLGALPHAFEGLLGYLIDYADGDDYYSSRRMQRFQQRHPDSTNPALDWLTDAAGDVQQWALEQAGVAAESTLAAAKYTFDTFGGLLSALLGSYLQLVFGLMTMASTALNTLTALLAGARATTHTPWWLTQGPRLRAVQLLSAAPATTKCAQLVCAGECSRRLLRRAMQSASLSLALLCRPATWSRGQPHGHEYFWSGAPT